MIRRDPWTGDATALEDDLRRSVRGEVRFDAGSRAVYSTDASNYRQVPIGVVVPRDADDLIAAVAACRRQGAPIVHRGAGTSLAGQSCNVAVMIDSSRHLTGVLGIDAERRTARVRPGTVLDDLRGAALRHGLTFGPDPATHAWCTVGGMIGNNSCGVHSLTTGRTSDNVEELEIVTYDGLRLRVGATPEREIDRIVRSGGRRGEIYRRLRELRDRYADVIRERFPRLSRRVSGYNLDDLLPERGFHVARALAGTEGTCVSVLEATVRLAPAPKVRVLLVLGYPDVVRAAEAVPELLGAKPYGLEGMDRFLVDNELTRRSYRETLSRLPPGDAWLLVEFGGETLEEAVAQARGVASGAGALLLETPEEQARIWQVREAAVATTSRDPRLGDGWPGWEDSAVAPERFAAYLRDLLILLDHHKYRAAFYGHFGEGCLHARIDFDFSTPAAIRTYRTFMEEAADLVVAHGGSLSGEHGDGQQRGELLTRMFGEELVQAFREFKAIWDPGNRMNPGKKVDPYPLDADLRPALRLADPPAVFGYAGDRGGFARAVTRCVGVGKCRRDAGGTMCPSFLVTHDETHSTRGRSRLLFEMLAGDVVRDGWRSEEVREALDLCLACKACRAECPAGVDMATYKAEFLHHHFAGRPRPRAAYAMGLIPWWARLASRVPGLANGMTQGAFSGVMKKLGGIHPDRTLPAFASRTFRDGFVADRGGKPTVLLWPDTFTNFFQPEIAHAAVEVLKAAGHRVAIPARVLCCGRPLYDFGMLDLARRQLRQILAALKEEIAAGLPMVGLEPSCVAVFRDELVNLFPEDEAARRLSAQTFTLAEFLVRSGFEPPKTSGRAIVHGHCHHHAVMGMDADRSWLGALGLDVQVLDSGCCGMAGAFGFETDHYEISLAAAERVLLPAVRATGPDVAILADGFSCREQIRQGAGRRAMHLSEVAAAALRR
jgi:FAD/FMN-containing dehydrogenase/Fe-S oxidoreductase